MIVSKKAPRARRIAVGPGSEERDLQRGRMCWLLMSAPRAEELPEGTSGVGA
ncbi:MAG: hypothetical protein M0008_03450 [Actinomycetota bacterium]|nr:hypothetical protein [Actinomycetota bacterium]